MREHTDILSEIPDQNLPKLAQLYEGHVTWAPHVLSLIHTGMRWKKTSKYKDGIKFLSLSDSWRIDGTLIVLMQFHCYDIFVFTLDPECKHLYQGLASTTLIDYRNPLAAFFCVHENHLPTVLRLVEEKKLKFETLPPVLHIYIMPPQRCEAVIGCPAGAYVKKLDPKSANQIDAVWPHRFPGSEKYLEVLIEMNGGYGLFLENTDEMVAWVVKHCFGHIGMLQTEENYKKRGYGAVVAKFLAKEIVEEGHWPFATVYDGNDASLRLFERLGFEKKGVCTYVH